MCFDPTFKGKGSVIVSKDVLDVAAVSSALVSVGEPVHGQDEDPEFDSGARWTQLTGRRLAKGLGFVTDPTTPMTGSVMVLAFAPLRFTFAWFLRVAELRESTPAALSRPVPALDLQFGPCSPVHFALQFYSKILVRSTWTPAGLPALLREYARPGPMARLLVIRLVRMLWDAICGLSYRFRDRFDSWPMKLLRLCDARVPLQDRMAIASEFADACNSHDCCLPAGAATRIRNLLRLSMHSCPPR
jgi:hypothetical protein